VPGAAHDGIAPAIARGLGLTSGKDEETPDPNAFMAGSGCVEHSAIPPSLKPNLLKCINFL
jgi:hypothetical protein